jgi:dienelactone hydrolase
MRLSKLVANAVLVLGVSFGALGCEQIDAVDTDRDQAGGLLGGLGGSGGASSAGEASKPNLAAAIIRGGAPTEATVNNAGPFRVRSYGLFQKGDVRNGAQYADFDIYYPEGAAPPLSLVAIVPGFISDRSWVGDWAPFVASHGIAAILIDTNWLTDSPEARKAALLDAIVSLKAENAREGSPLKGQLDTSRAGVIGWSMGGGGALLAGVQDPALKAIVALCPWNLFSFSYIGLRVPAMLFGGDADILAGGMPNDFYAAMPWSTPKVLFDLSGGDHWYANSPNGHWNAVGRFGISFLKVFLEGDERYRKFLKVNPGGLHQFEHNL